MMIGVACHEHGEVESESLVRAVRQLGHQSIAFTLSEVEFSFDERGLGGQLGNNFDLRALDLIISRANIGNERRNEDVDRYQLLCRLDVPITDASAPFLTAESKLATMALLAGHRIPMPATRICRQPETLQLALAAFGDTVVKPSFGYGGDDVQRIGANTNRSVLEELFHRHGQLLVQKYIPHSDGDFRVTVAGGDVLFVARRIPNAKTWKANVSQGADVRVIDDPPSEVCALGLRAANVLGLFLAGVDILPFESGYVVLEVNNCPGWTDLDAPFKETVARKIVDHAIAWVNL